MLVENLELYSLAPLLIKRVRSLTVLLAVTNALNAAAHESWRRHKETGQQKIADYVVASLALNGGKKSALEAR